jgi:cytoskeletal protein CcmA (bactofilin family)
MNTTAQIGPTIHIKGDVTSQEPLTIAGHVQGTIKVDGHALTVSPEGHVKGAMTAETIDVAGHVKGRVQGAVRIVVHETAKVDGDLSAPSVRLVDGATVHGRIETSARNSAGLKLAS